MCDVRHETPLKSRKIRKNATYRKKGRLDKTTKNEKPHSAEKTGRKTVRSLKYPLLFSND